MKKSIGHLQFTFFPGRQTKLKPDVQDVKKVNLAGIL